MSCLPATFAASVRLSHLPRGRLGGDVVAALIRLDPGGFHDVGGECIGQNQLVAGLGPIVFRRRRDLVVSRVNAIPGLSTPVPDGAFYCLVDAAPLMERFGHDDGKLALHLLDHGVAPSAVVTVSE